MHFCPENLFFWDFANFSIGKTFFADKKCTLFTICIFEINMLRRIFDTPFAVFKEKKFNLLEEKINTLEKLKVKNAINRSVFR
jgi:hypothetical protein